MEASDILEVAVTCPDEATAPRLGRAAVETRLAACANVSGPVRSLYWWDGAVQDEPEWSLTLKSSEPRRERLQALLTRLHPYDLPVIVALRAQVAPEVAQWVAAETDSMS